VATIRYLDALGATQLLDLVGESGMLPLDALFVSYPDPSSTFQDNGTRIQQLIYSGGLLRLRYDYIYSNVVAPYPDKLISQINVYGPVDQLLQEWSGLSVSLQTVIATNALPIFQGEDRIEGNSSSNVLQGALGDDLILGLLGNDALHGGRADDTLIGGVGDDTLFGGLGTDTAAFYGPSASYRWAKNSDGSITITDAGSGLNDGADRLYDVEWLLFNYGTDGQVAIRARSCFSMKLVLLLGGGHSTR